MPKASTVKTKTPSRSTTKKASAKKPAAKASPKAKPASKKSPAKRVEAAGDEEVTLDRRSAKNDRRQAPEVDAAGSPELKPRKKVNRRRQIDPTTCERDYTDAEVEFMNAMDEYKRASGRMFPTCSEVLEVIRSLGYAQLTAAELAAREPAPTGEEPIGDEPTGTEGGEFDAEPSSAGLSDAELLEEAESLLG